MKIEFDPNKSNKNFEERELAFNMVAEFEWESSVVREDARKNYPEKRYIASGFLRGRVCVVCFTHILEGIRVISLRKANKREVGAYETAINQ